MATDSPFLTFKIECPICKTVNEFDTVRVGAYSEGGRDTDFCPSNIKWRFPRYQGYNPLLFFIATCENCYYSREMNNKFKDWKSDNHFKTYRLRTIKEKHLEELSVADSPTKLMGTHIDTARYPNESAVLKLLLSIYDEQLSEKPNALDLGRFYVRTGWIFRDMARGEDPTAMVLRGMMNEIDIRYSQIKTSLETLSNDTQACSATIHSHFDSNQLSSEVKSRMLQYRDNFVEHLEGLGSLTDTFDAKLTELAGQIDEYRNNLVGGSDGAGPGFHHHQTFEIFLGELKKKWPGAACNEVEALREAVKYYREAFANGRDISPGNQQIQASYMIAELSRRVGDHDVAKQYFTSTIKAGQELIYQNRHDQSRTILARKIMELAIEQGRANLAAAKPA